MPKSELDRLRSYKDNNLSESDLHEGTKSIRRKAIAEAWRMLGENGLLVWQGAGERKI